MGALLDYALSVGTEGETPPLPSEESEIAEAIKAVAESDQHVNDARKDISDLTRLAAGLEGLMIEVVQNNGADPDDVALDALRVAAQTVRRELLDDEQRSAIDDIVERRQSVGNEGFGDMVRSIQAKALFAIGNFIDAFKRSIMSTNSLAVKNQRLIDDLIKRIESLPETNFSAKFNAKQAAMMVLGDKADLLGSAGAAPEAIDIWFSRPLLATIAESEKIQVLFDRMIRASTLDEFTAARDEIQATKSLPIPSEAAKCDTIRGKHYIFDAYKLHESFAAISRVYYVARPEQNSVLNTPYLSECDAYSMAFSDMVKRSARLPTSGEASCSKADLINGLKNLRQALNNIGAYYNHIQMLGKVWQDYDRSCAEYKTFTSRDWVNNALTTELRVASYMLGNLFDLGCAGSVGTIFAINDLAGLFKSVVYSSTVGA